MRDQRVGCREGGELLEVLDRREDEQDLACGVGVERALRREPSMVDDLLAVDPGFCLVRERREEEVRVEAGLHLGRRDPARVLHQGRGVDPGDAGLLVELADGAHPVCLVALALVRIDRATGEHPGAAHEARRGIALDQEELEVVRAATHDDDRRGLPGNRLGAGLVELLAGPGAVDLTHALQGTFEAMEASMTTTQKWICESCGFIYDPADGDPDGGIPPGTAFTDIPDTWFCPVCGARKRDFVPYED